MAKAGTSKKQKKSTTKSLKAHDPFKGGKPHIRFAFVASINNEFCGCLPCVTGESS